MAKPSKDINKLLKEKKVFNFKPTINENSEKLYQKYKDKVISVQNQNEGSAGNLQGKDPHMEYIERILLHDKKRIAETQKVKEELEKKELKECTFKPKINQDYISKKEKSRGTKETRGKYNCGKTIRKRDKSVYKRLEFGHWEADTVVSGRGKSKACFATLAERKTRFYIAIKMPDKSANSMVKAIMEALSGLPDDAVKTITCDRGSEFANWQIIEEKLNCKVYFTDPYCAWQKGTNENLNGLLREFYPKGRNLSRVSPATLKKNLALINARPKKVLGFNKPVDLFDLSISQCCT